MVEFDWLLQIRFKPSVSYIYRLDSDFWSFYSSTMSGKAKHWLLTVPAPVEQVNSLEWLSLGWNNGNKRVDGQPNDVGWIQNWVYQLEKGEDSGYRHYQVYIECWDQLRFNRVKERVPQDVHIEQRKGPREAAIAYCSKEDSRVPGCVPIASSPEFLALGTKWDANKTAERKKRKQSTNKKLEEMLDDLDKGMPTHEVTKKHRYMAFMHGQKIAQYTANKIQPRPFGAKVRGVWLWGSTGMGKSMGTMTWLHAQKKPHYIWVPKNSIAYFDGYQGEEYIVLEEMAYGFFEATRLNSMMNSFNTRIAVHGGMVECNGRVFIATSNMTIEQCFKNAPPLVLDAVKRRFIEINVDDIVGHIPDAEERIKRIGELLQTHLGEELPNVDIVEEVPQEEEYEEEEEEELYDAGEDV